MNQPMANVGANKYRFLSAIKAINNFKPFSFVKDFMGEDIIYFNLETQLNYF